jgi:hypothetical protein
MSGKFETTTVQPQEDYELVICDSEALRSIARRHFSNWPILLPDVLWLPDLLSPLSLLNPYEPRLHHHVILREKTILAGASVLRYNEPNYTANKSYHHLMAIDVRPTCRGEGLARCLLKSVFGKAMEARSVLELSEFTEDGKSRVLPLIARLHHQNFTGLEVFYTWASQTIDGSGPYSVEIQGAYDWKIHPL